MEIESTTWQDWTVLSVQGDFVVKHLVEIRKKLEPVEELDAPKVALDLSGTSYIDSSAISLILNVRRRLDNLGGRLVVYGANRDLREIFAVVDLQHAVELYDTRGQFETAAGA